MIKFAKVLAIDSSNVLLKLDHNMHCSDCTKNCSGGFLKFLFHKNDNTLDVSLTDKNNNQIFDDKGFFDQSHEVNDLIGINVMEKQLLIMAFMMYGLPLVILLIMLFVGANFFEFMGLNADFGGLLGITLGLYLVKTFNHYFNNIIKPKVIFFK